MEKEIFEFDKASIEITTSSAGIFQAYTGQAEPNWAYRLWKASLVLAHYLDQNSASLKNRLVIDLGAGTGLLSILSCILGAYASVCTDQSVAVPLILHNARANLRAQQVLPLDCDNYSFREASNAKCSKDHILLASLTESDEYMCNICEDEVPEAHLLYSCRLCNFDCCVACAEIIRDPNKHKSLPSWYQFTLEKTGQAANNDAGAGSSDGVMAVATLDWNEPSHYRAILDKLGAALSSPIVQEIPLLIAADVTYSQHSTQLFFSCLQYIANFYSSHGEVLKALLCHHMRSEATMQLVYESIAAHGWSSERLPFSYEHIPDLAMIEAKGKGQESESEHASSDEVVIIQISIPLIDAATIQLRC
jgi:hypothetical protein